MSASAVSEFDVVVVGGGPAGASAAATLAERGHRVALLDRAGRIKPCGGAIPPRLVRDFAIPDELIEARVQGARIIAPSGRRIDMPIENGYVGMVDRETFDEWLRERARRLGAERRTGTCSAVERLPGGRAQVSYEAEREDGGSETVRLNARVVIAADGARSRIARDCLPQGGSTPSVYAFHEVVESPPGAAGEFDPSRCEVYYQGGLSPDFYGWIFPHGRRTSVGAGTAEKGFSLRQAVRDLSHAGGLGAQPVIRREGAPIPLKPLKRWDDGRNVVVAGDAAGVVAPASGEGIYYAMVSGVHAAEAAAACVTRDDSRALATARKRFMSEHGRVFFILGIMQRFWYSSDARRERFVKMCADQDVQRLTWEAYMNKKLVYARPAAHLRIFFKDLAHLLRLAPT